MRCKITIADEVNVKIHNLPVDVRRKIANKLKFQVPYARYLPQYKLGRWDGKVGFFGLGGNGFVNHLDVIINLLHQNGVEIDEVEDQREKVDLAFTTVDKDYLKDKVWPKGHVAEGQNIELRDYQVEVINNFLKTPQSLQEVATGAGKTIITACLSKICEPLGRTLVIVPNKGLVTQTEDDYKIVGLDVGVYFGDRKELNKTHTICTWQSLNVLDKKTKDGEAKVTLTDFLQGVKTVIIDEVHQAKAEVLKKLLTQHLNHAPIRWGLTGTIPKDEHEAVGCVCSLGPVIGNLSSKELQEKGVLANLDINIIQLQDGVLGFNNYAQELKWLVTDKDRIEEISSIITSISGSGNTLVLIDRIATGQILSDMFPEWVFISGDMKVADRQKEYREVSEMDNKVIVATYGVAAVGINIPRIFNLVLLEPGKSFVRVIQSIGRGIRKAEDKDYLNVIDITSNLKYSKRHLTKRKAFYKEQGFPFQVTKLEYK